MNASPLSCPKCGSQELRPAYPFQRRVNVWIFLFGGMLLSTLWSHSRTKEMRCNQCDTVFKESTSKLRLFVVGFFILLVLLTIFGLLEKGVD